MNQNSVIWNQEEGTISLVGDAGEERLFIARKGFIEAFSTEIIREEGENAFVMTMKNTLKKLGIDRFVTGKPAWNHFERFNDEKILPISIEGSTVHDYLKWDGKTRVFRASSGTEFSLWTLDSFHKLHEAMVDILTERGAVAILHYVAKRAAMDVGQKVMDDYGWNEIDAFIENLDPFFRFIYPVLGWGRPRAVSKKIEPAKKGDDVTYMTLVKVWNSFESHNKKSNTPACIIMRSYLEGITECLGNVLENQSVETREVKCRAMGDEYCAFAAKSRLNSAVPLDWKSLEPQWKALDGLELGPV